ncbi:MAG: ribonuclease HI family protein [Candidatus Kaelpia imicola]|nr:ribonuclease HI family protein [Candidatus Kaelpia imicola]
MSSFRLYSDGSSRGNPGPAGVGVVIKDSHGVILKELSLPIGSSTNNVAEYLALIVGLTEALLLGIDDLKVFLDSELLVKQVKGEYKTKKEHLKPLLVNIKYLLNNFESIEFNHILREENREADKLAYSAAESKDVLF